MRFSLPEKVNQVINGLKNAGFEAYAVGGCVRDLLLGRVPDDWDITTSATPTEVKGIFRRTFDTGIEHGTVTVMLGNDHFEVTTYRLDGKYSDNRHPDGVTFTRSLKEDLKRRDFTINALAYNEEDGIKDEFSGMEDLKNGIIRAVGDPSERFKEDALRILRAFRFSAQLDFRIEEKTCLAAVELKENLKNISAERIQTEFTKLICSDHPEKIRQLYETGITGIILPEIDICFKTDQKNKHHMYNVGEHIMQALIADAGDIHKREAEYVSEDKWQEFLSTTDALDRECKIEDARAKKYIRYALLFHDMGKPDCMTEDENGSRHFKGHALRSAEIAKDILNRLKVDNEMRHAVCELVKYHDYRPELSKKAVRRAMSRTGRDIYRLLIPIRLADTLAQSSYKRAEKLDYEKGVMQAYMDIVKDGECVTVKELAVNGSDLIEHGIKEGPAIGKKLSDLLELVLENPECNTKEYLLSKL
ncbi:MAG: CCA tRNA nucleotidyltransferase [Lachnospiraceae bacterium]|nr:CCA tRNA nucleotidyltransferase [Lachnospiraceae bacterium]